MTMCASANGSRRPRLLVALVLTAVACGSTEPTQVVLQEPWPNEPAGFTLVTDYGFDDSLPSGNSMAIPGSGGWFINNGGALRLADGTSRMPGGFVGQWSYPAGFSGGGAPANMFYDVQGGTELYIAFYWKPSSPWQFHSSNVNKICFQFAGGGGGGGGQALLSMKNNRTIRATLEFSTGPDTNLEPNVRQSAVTLGQWHVIEWYMNKATRTMRWWVDGALQGQYTNVDYPSHDFDEFQFSPTWGGVGETKTENDYYRYDHVRISKR